MKQAGGRAFRRYASVFPGVDPPFPFPFSGSILILATDESKCKLFCVISLNNFELIFKCLDSLYKCCFGLFNKPPDGPPPNRPNPFILPDKVKNSVESIEKTEIPPPFPPLGKITRVFRLPLL